MRIAVVGPGAIGCLFAGMLAKSGQDVWLLDKTGQKRTEKIASEGIRIEGLSGKHKVKVNITSRPEDINKPQFILICVKSYDTETAVKRIKSFLSDDSYVVTLQNGLGNVDTIAEVAGENNLIAGVTSQASTLLSEGCVRHLGKGETIIGRWQVSGKKQARQWKIPRRSIEELADVFKNAGFPTKVSDKMKDVIWSKLIINAGVNALAAVTRLTNGRLLEYEGSRHILKQAVLEASKVARRKKISFDYSDPLKKTESICSATSENISSMLQDILKKQKTEIDYINGAIAREAEALEIKAPVNNVLTYLVKTIENSYNKEVKS